MLSAAVDATKSPQREEGEEKFCANGGLQMVDIFKLSF